MTFFVFNLDKSLFFKIEIIILNLVNNNNNNLKIEYYINIALFFEKNTYCKKLEFKCSCYWYVCVELFIRHLEYLQMNSL